jgi:transcription antitermination protein NusB
VLNRRHIRVKVMQSIYAMHQSKGENLEKQEKFLKYSQDAVQDLYLMLFSALIEICKTEKTFLELSAKKHLASPEEKKPILKFVNNKVFQILTESNALSIAFADRKINYWELNSDYIQILLSEIKASSLYKKYINIETNSFDEDKNFILDVFTEIIAPNEKLYEYIEDNNLTWIDDIALVNTQIHRDLKAITAKTTVENFKISKLYKDIDDMEFSTNLFKKTVLNEAELTKEFADKTPNWDIERIAEIDTIIMKMAICEFLKFPSIPTKVTINEYLELAKDYSTPKSSFFINGILDVIVKELSANGKIQKIGRGLI